jgi:hypothetical protein
VSYKGGGSEHNVYSSVEDEFGVVQCNPEARRGKNKYTTKENLIATIQCTQCLNIYFFAVILYTLK